MLRWLALPALALTLMAQADVTLEAGRWEERFVPTRIVVDGKPMAADELAKQVETRSRCATAEQAADPLRFLLGREMACGTPRMTGGAAGFTVSVECPAPQADGPRTMQAQGSWRRDGFEISLSGNGPAGAHDVAIDARIEGRHAGPCRGDENGGEGAPLPEPEKKQEKEG